MNRFFVQAILAGALAGCCFGGTPSTPGTTTTTTTPVGGMTNLAPGFTPDPNMLSGTAGGPMQASTYGMDCRGTIAMTPNHVLNLTAPFAMLRLSVTSSADTTIVVRLPNGQTICNDDTNGLNPEAAGPMGPGQVQIFVGTYSTGSTGTPYTLAVSQTAPFAGGYPPPSYPPPYPPPTGALGPGGIPLDCGLVVAQYGTVMVGSSVVLGGHTPYTGPDGQGGFVTDDTNWAPEMGAFVGQRTIVTSLDGLDPAGCPGIRVQADNGQYFWRLRNVSF